MTTQELRELDAWIAEHVMGWRHAKTLDDLGVMDSFYDHGDILIEYRKGHLCPWRPTEDSADAMDVLKKCAEKLKQDISIVLYDSKWDVAWVDWNAEERADLARAETLELAICLFAKQLFSQTTK